jgi:uncharacterized membrane protein
MAHALPYPNLDLVLTAAVATIAALRAEGRTVLLHCVQALSRTPIVAALMARGSPAVPCVTLWPTFCLLCPGQSQPRPAGGVGATRMSVESSRVQLIFVPVPIAHTARSFGQLFRGLVIEM